MIAVQSCGGGRVIFSPFYRPLLVLKIYGVEVLRTTDGKPTQNVILIERFYNGPMKTKVAGGLKTSPLARITLNIKVTYRGTLRRKIDEENDLSGKP